MHLVDYLVVILDLILMIRKVREVPLRSYNITIISYYQLLQISFSKAELYILIVFNFALGAFKCDIMLQFSQI